MILTYVVKDNFPEQQSKGFSRHSLFVKTLLTKEVAAINCYFPTSCIFCSCCKRV